MAKRLSLIMIMFLLMTNFAEGLCENFDNDYLNEHDFGDFKMTFGSDMKCVLHKKEADGVWFQIFPNKYEYGQNYSCIQCYWLPGRAILANVGTDNYANGLITYYSEPKEVDGDFMVAENIELLEATDCTLDGELMYSVTLKMDIQGATVYVNHRLVSVIDSGTYSFVASSENKSEFDKYEDILNTLKWTIKNRSVVKCELQDFDICFNSGTLYNTFDKISGQAYFIALPDYDEDAAFHKNISCVWDDKTYDISKDNIQQFVESGFRKTLDILTGCEIDAYISNISEASKCKLGGKPAFLWTGTFKIDSTDVYIVQCIVSNKSIGTYIFAVGGTNTDDITYLLRTLDTITWKR